MRYGRASTEAFNEVTKVKLELQEIFRPRLGTRLPLQPHAPPLLLPPVQYIRHNGSLHTIWGVMRHLKCPPYTMPSTLSVHGYLLAAAAMIHYRHHRGPRTLRRILLCHTRYAVYYVVHAISPCRSVCCKHWPWQPWNWTYSISGSIYKRRCGCTLRAEDFDHPSCLLPPQH